MGCRDRRRAGLTWIELLVVIAVIAILATVAVPSFTRLVDRHQLRGAANALYSDLILARMEALRRNAPVSVSFGIDPLTGRWCHGLSDRGPCDCLQPGGCLLSDAPARVTQGNDARVSLTTNLSPAATATFNPARGTANAGTTRLVSSAGRVDVVVSSLGRVRLCSPELGEYPPC